jgi:hypothetical protein
MSKIITDNKIVSIEVQPEETLIIKFNPDGFNAIVNSNNFIELSIGTIFLPSGRIGLILRLPANNTYRNGASFVVLDDPNGMDSLTFNGLTLNRVNDAV